MRKISSVLFAVYLATQEVKSYSQSLTDCQTVANKFSNTCTGAPSTAATWDSSFTGATVSCSQTTCPTGYGTAPSCSWTRKLCVTCSQSSGVTYMRIQTNGLPNHCFSTPSTTDEQKVDFQFKFNVATSSLTTTTFASQSAFDTYTCSVTKSSSVDSAVGFSNYLSSDSSALDLSTVFGVSTNGVIILSSASTDEVDPFYPKAWTGSSTTTAESVDACLGHPNGNDVYHYHILPPCILNAANVQTTSACAAVSACSSDLAGYALDNFANYKSLQVLGIAKDGHIIYGPYKSDGTAYDCTTFDQCGGTTMTDGDYGYIWHTTFPYTMSCFGPGETLTYTASCSTNTCSASTSSFSQGMKSSIIAIILGFAMIFGMLY